MKERRVFMTLALILGVLLLGVAYAAITTQNLNVTGNITTATSDANLDVKFTGNVTSSGEGTVNGYIDTNDTSGRTAVINVSNLTTKGQVATASINIINNSSDINATPVISNVMYSNTTWFKVEAELGETTYWDSATQQPILQPGETVPLNITVELLDTPATDAEVAQAKDTMTIKVSADATDAELVEYGTGGVELITFTIAGTEYQAEAGMTWEEWCDSSYNSGGYYCSGNGNILEYSGVSYVFHDSAYKAAVSYEAIESVKWIHQPLYVDGPDY